MKYNLIDEYVKKCDNDFKDTFTHNDGFIDSLRQNLIYHDVHMLNLLLKAFLLLYCMFYCSLNLI